MCVCVCVCFYRYLSPLSLSIYIYIIRREYFKRPIYMLSIPVLLLASCEDWTCNLQMIVSLGNQRL